MLDTWTVVEWEAFECLGPQGMDASFWKPGSLEDDDCDVDTSREGARDVVKGSNMVKHGRATSMPAMDENVAARNAIAIKMAAHTKMANKRLILLFGALDEKAQVIKDVTRDQQNGADAKKHIESEE